MRGRVYDAFGACHLLFNNAGVGGGGVAKPWNWTPNDWKWCFGVNVFGLAHCVQSFVPRMLASGEEGWVVNTSSDNGGYQPMADLVMYAASKAAITAYAEALENAFRNEDTTLHSAVFYPGGNGILETRLWNSGRNRPDQLAREHPHVDQQWDYQEHKEARLAAGAKVADLVELGRSVLQGVREGKFIINMRLAEGGELMRQRAERIAARRAPDDHGLTFRPSPRPGGSHVGALRRPEEVPEDPVRQRGRARCKPSSIGAGRVRSTGAHAPVTPGSVRAAIVTATAPSLWTTPRSIDHTDSKRRRPCGASKLPLPRGTRPTTARRRSRSTPARRDRRDRSGSRNASVLAVRSWEVGEDDHRPGHAPEGLPVARAALPCAAPLERADDHGAACVLGGLVLDGVADPEQEDLRHVEHREVGMPHSQPREHRGLRLVDGLAGSIDRVGHARALVPARFTCSTNRASSSEYRRCPLRRRRGAGTP